MGLKQCKRKENKTLRHTILIPWRSSFQNISAIPPYASSKGSGTQSNCRLWMMYAETERDKRAQTTHRRTYPVIIVGRIELDEHGNVQASQDSCLCTDRHCSRQMTKNESVSCCCCLLFWRKKSIEKWSGWWPTHGGYAARNRKLTKVRMVEVEFLLFQRCGLLLQRALKL